MKKEFTCNSTVQIFPQDGGWHYVAIPKEYTDTLEPIADRGLVAVRATVGGSSWDTSLLPMGDGTQFLALPAKVRDKEGIQIDDTVDVSFVIRRTDVSIKS